MDLNDNNDEATKTTPSPNNIVKDIDVYLNQLQQERNKLSDELKQLAEAKSKLEVN